MQGGVEEWEDAYPGDAGVPEVAGLQLLQQVQRVRHLGVPVHELAQREIPEEGRTHRCQQVGFVTEVRLDLLSRVVIGFVGDFLSEFLHGRDDNLHEFRQRL